MTGTRFTICADSHGDCIDPIARDAFLSFVADYKPRLRIHLGDAFDFRNLRKGASDEEKAESLQDDWKAGSHFLREYFGPNRATPCGNVLLRGNHDERIYDLAGSAVGVMRDYAEEAVKRFERLLKRYNIEQRPYDSRLGVWQRGELRCIHGYAAGRNAASVMARVYGNVCFGHIHTIESCPVETIDGPSEARCIGALCKIDMPYNARQPAKLRHNNGWAYGVLFEDGTYQIFQATRIGDNFYAAADIKTYGKAA